jgi:hypothetical protein
MTLHNLLCDEVLWYFILLIEVNFKKKDLNKWEAFFLSSLAVGLNPAWRAS